jgi:hypothetical protein
MAMSRRDDSASEERRIGSAADLREGRPSKKKLIYVSTRVSLVQMPQNRTKTRRSCSSADRRFVPIGGTPLRKKQLDLFWRKLNIIRKNGEFSFKVSRIG